MIIEAVGKAGRAIFKIRFRILGLATIKNIPTEEFKELIQELRNEGWWKYGVYDGYDAWIDYGKVKLRKGFSKLTCEWDNWTEGSVEGRKRIVEKLAAKHGYEVSNHWRWR